MTAKWIKIQDRFGAEALALAEQAAPGSWYTRQAETWDAEFDDDSGWYVNIDRYYDGLYSKQRKKLTIESPAAYELFSEHLGGDEDEERDDSLASEQLRLRVHMSTDRFVDMFGKQAQEYVDAMWPTEDEEED